MKFSHVHVDGFGVWSDLSLVDLSPDCTVFYGPNEAGKSTLLQFVRAVLYGFSPGRTARYLPPVHSEIGGGRITAITDDEGLLQIQRQENSQQPLGQITVQAADGTVQGAAHLQRLLHDVDETTFQNVFAVGLRELQELATLTDSDAARWLYDLSLGLDRATLSDVLVELENSRERLWSAHNQSQISQLLTQRKRLQDEVAEYSHLSLQLEQWVRERIAADQLIAQLENALAEQEAKHRTLETAASLHDPWHRRQSLNARIETLGPAANWPVDALDRMHRLCTVLRQGRRKKKFFARGRKALSDKLAQIKLNAPLWKQAARIEALGENETWIASLEQELRQAEETVKRLTTEREAQRNQFASPASPAAGANSPQSTATSQPSAGLQPIDHRTWRALRRPAAALLQAQQQSAAQRQDINDQRVAQQNRRRDVEQAIAARGQKNLAAALDTAGQRVAQLRRRVQLDELLDQLAHTKTDLEKAIAGYLERQILPAWMLFSLGGIFVLGVVLILGGLLLPGSFTGSLGWPMAWLGLLGIGAAVTAKYTMERSAANQLEASRRQLTLVESQTGQAEAERAELDRTLPKGSGTWPARLQTAQEELAKLEELLPLDAQRQAADQAAQEIESRSALVEQSSHAALENWQATLTACGLHEDLTPQQARAMYRAADQLDATQQQLTAAQADVDRRRRELAVFTARIEQVFLAAEILPNSSSAAEQLRQLHHELSEQAILHKNREELGQRRRKLRRRGQAMVHRLRRMQRRRRRLLDACHVPNLAEFQRRAAEFSQIALLISQRDAAVREISSVLIGAGSEANFAAIVANTPAEQLTIQVASSRQQLEDLRRQQQRLFEERGQRSEQIRLASSDRRPAVKRFELAQVEQQLTTAMNRWHVLTLTRHWLQLIKEHYERYRQPETLRQASEYLAQLTSGRYRRVWTRWGENALLVDDDEHRTLPVEVLSQGTREQLFLSLRLALVALFARRGMNLPMVLDDVLVNFDADRAAAAVHVLQNFARQGHQLLLFTCHEHLARLFKTQRVDVRRLPSNRQSGRDEPFMLEVEPPQRRNRPRRVKSELELPQPVVPLTSVVTAQGAGPEVSVETTPIHAVEMPPVETILPFPHPIIEPSADPPPRVPLRIDVPQRAVRLSPIMRRWAAEEFSGELDDRVNPHWLLNGIVWEEMSHAASSGDGLSETHAPTSFLSRRFKGNPQSVGPTPSTIIDAAADDEPSDS